MQGKQENKDNLVVTELRRTTRTKKRVFSRQDGETRAKTRVFGRQKSENRTKTRVFGRQDS